MSVVRYVLAVLATGLALCFWPPAARAATTVTLDAVDSGWYSSSGNHNDASKNYIVGKFGASQFRNYFVFDTTTVRGPIIAATLRVQNPPLGYASIDPTETYTTYDVATPVADLRASNAGRTDIFTDLGTGTVLGAADVPDPSDGALIDIVLTGNTLAALNATRGQFALGGALTSMRGQDSEYLFGGSDETSVRQLVLTVGPPVIISEFRFAGAAGSADEFVELYNNDFGALTVSTNDGSAGWALVAADGSTRAVIPNGTVLPVRGHFLVVNNAAGGYSLADYGGPGRATGDATYTSDIPDGGGLALFQTSNPAGFTLANRLDAVGFSGGSNALYREGAGLLPAGGVAPGAQASFVRVATSGGPRDTDDNAADFVLVTTGGSGANDGLQLGAPAPENLTSPVQHNALIKATLLEPQQLSAAAPNRVRDTTATGPNAAFGTLTIRRKFTNKTGQPVTQLRFRIVDITTLNTPNPGGAQADLRALDAVDVTVQTSAGAVLVRGTTLETPPAQAQGGGVNSSLLVALPGGALTPNASVNVQFVLGVQANGTFRFLVNVEALTSGPGLGQPGGLKQDGAGSKILFQPTERGSGKQMR